MRTVLGITYGVQPNSKQTFEECFLDLRNRCETWIKGKYDRQGRRDSEWQLTAPIEFNVDNVKRELLKEHSLLCRYERVDSGELWSVIWEHPHDSDSFLQWQTSLTIVRYEQAVEFTLVLRLANRQLILRPARFNLGMPRLVSDILDTYPVHIADWPVPTGVEVADIESIQGVVENTLLSKERRLPAVLVSPDIWNGSFGVSSEGLFSKLRGLAHVVRVSDKWTAFRLTNHVGKEFTCFNGAVRIYWPQFSLSDDRFYHKLFLPHTIRTSEANGYALDETLFRTIAGVSADRHIEGSTARNFWRAIRKRHTEEAERVRQAIRSGATERSNLETQLIDSLSKNESYEETLIEKECRIEELLEEVSALRESFRQYQGNESSAEVDHADSNETEFLVETVADAVVLAQDKFGETIEFHPEAEKMAQDSPYRNPIEVFGVFEAINELMAKLRKQEALGTTWKEEMRRRGYAYKPDVSDTAKGKKFYKQFEVIYKGRKIDAVEHITIGIGQDPQECISVYWWKDEEQKRVIVTRCGKHPENTKT